MLVKKSCRRRRVGKKSWGHQLVPTWALRSRFLSIQHCNGWWGYVYLPTSALMNNWRSIGRSRWPLSPSQGLLESGWDLSCCQVVSFESPRVRIALTSPYQQWTLQSPQMVSWEGWYDLNFRIGTSQSDFRSSTAHSGQLCCHWYLCPTPVSTGTFLPFAPA